MIRNGAEKAWNAVGQATDHAMQRPGRAPRPGRDAHKDRKSFFEGLDRVDLAQDYSYFEDRLHGDVFYEGDVLPVSTARKLLEGVRDYIGKVATL